MIECEPAIHRWSRGAKMEWITVRKSVPLAIVAVVLLVLPSSVALSEESQHRPSDRYRTGDVPLSLRFFLDGVGLTGDESLVHGSDLGGGAGGEPERFASFGKVSFQFVQNFWLVIIRDYTHEKRIEEISLSIRHGGIIPDFFDEVFRAYMDELSAADGVVLERLENTVPGTDERVRTVRFVTDSAHGELRLDAQDFSLTVVRLKSEG
jgi:hypothetical protein